MESAIEKVSSYQFNSKDEIVMDLMFGRHQEIRFVKIFCYEIVNTSGFILQLLLQKES